MCPAETYLSADRLSCRSCDSCQPPTKFRRNGDECTRSRNTICTDCIDNKITTGVDFSSCNTCASGYFSQASGITFVCAKCTDYPCGANQFISCANAVRVCQPCPGVTASTACAWGQEPNKQCDGTSTEPSQCRNCLAGSERPSGSTSLICEKCKTGFYKDTPSASSCSPCANAPAANSVYLPWGNRAADTSDCPWGCNLGFYRLPGSPNRCVSCALTSGTFANSTLATACSLCSNRPASSTYYLVPMAVGGFNAASNNCPWECNAGFIKNTAGTGCVPCQTGVTYRTASSNVLTEGQTNVCLPCLQCVAGRNFQTTACSPTVNRVCRACSTSCASNFFQSSPCTNSSNLGCTRCQTRCPVGQYQTLSGTCSGNTNFDAFLAACRPCLGPEDCGPGRYVSRVCPGTDRTPNQCVVCSVIPPTGDCSASQYRGGCVNFTNTRCVPFTTCARTMPMYLAGESRTKDGVCRNCTRCADLGLAVLRNCSTYDDSVCRGAACNRSAPCQTPAALANRSRLFCDYSLGEASATCGVCPSGYGSDGQFCLECPRGKTCNRLGEVECQGQCRAGAVSVCTEDLSLGGSVSCDQACGAIVPGFGARWVRRGTHVRPEPGMCDTYFQCGAGYYKIFRSTGVVECEACPTSLLPSGGQLERWVTEGLSTGDAKSCLWECRPELARLNSGRTGCALLPGRSTVTGRNPAGWWLEPLSKATGQCASGRTSEAGAAINASECIQCHALPAGAVWTAGSSQCDWGCLQQTAGAQPRKRGGACVGVVAACASLPGYSARSGACEPTGFPWNRGGYSKSAGAGTAAAVVVAVVAAAESRGGAAASSGALQDGLAMASLPYGVEGRHSLTVAGRNGSLGVQGPLCSGARVRLGRHEFILGAVCNQSFLVFLNLSRPTTRGLEVLIGNSTPGWRDGFKTQALFESELYVAPSAWSNETLFVLDRWNCLLREVVLYGEPGGYLTRAYTVWGRTEKLASLVPEPRCYGAGGLAAPRRFWALRDGWVAFADDNGLWQFHTRTRDLVLMLRESDGGFEADELVDVDTTDEFTLRLVFADAVWLVSAEAQACPTDSTSMPGGDCTVDCAWLSSTLVPVRFVNRTGDGACVPCTQRECGYGEAFAACTRAEDGGCRPCEPRPEAGVYTDRGTCEDSAWRVGLPPCSAGSYATDGGRYCEPCPTLTATWRAGATDARQCKCLPGLVRRGDRCVAADGLYEFEVPCAAREACSIPPFARLHPGDLVGCRFECLPGYYHRVGAGWLDKCSPCLAAEGNASSSSSTVFVTRGDDDEPWSCEWGPY